nr:MAG TPA: hypothetical protein [Caudoviricetes sp.]
MFGILLKFVVENYRHVMRLSHQLISEQSLFCVKK